MSLSTSIKANLHECVVLVEIRLVQNVGFEVVVYQWLPSRWQAEDIEAVRVDEVLHLARRHVRRWTRVLLFEIIWVEVALVWC